jgi:hypothetical protein
VFYYCHIGHQHYFHKDKLTAGHYGNRFLHVRETHTIHHNMEEGVVAAALSLALPHTVVDLPE